MKKIGILGGTFNPIHYGHLLLGETAYQDFGLDKVLVMPNKNPGYKDIDKDISDWDRLNMVKLAIADNPHFELSTIEYEREGITYTADTLLELKAYHPDEEYYFIMGADSLFHMESWHKPEEILQLATILVAGRDGASRNEIDSQIDYLSNRFEACNIEYLDAPAYDISSYMIRKLVKSHKNIRYMVSETVREYIYENNLYI